MVIFVTSQLPHLLSVDPHDPVQLAAVRHHEPQEVVQVAEDVKACEMDFNYVDQCNIDLKIEELYP